MPVQLPPAFQFSQSSLQDYTDCARRFQLRYLMAQPWPAPLAEPLGDAEQADLLGQRFHRLVERYYLGVPIEPSKIDPALRGWWAEFMANPVPNLPTGKRLPEITVSVPVHGQRMTATFDLLAYEPGGAVTIVDWKTTRRPSKRAWLDTRLQTIVYPLLLVEASERLLGYAIKPEQVRLVYWFANAPQEIEVFEYSTARRDQDLRVLAALLDEVLAHNADPWPLTPNVQRCQLCQYRSLCDRGVEAGTFEDIDSDEIPTAFEPLTPDDYVL